MLLYRCAYNLDDSGMRKASNFLNLGLDGPVNLIIYELNRA